MASTHRNSAWRLWALGGVPGWQQSVREQALKALRAQGWLPRTMTLREEDGPQAFRETLATAVRPGPWPGALVLEGDGFSLYVDLDQRPCLELQAAPATLPRVVSWADSTFAAMLPDIAWAVPMPATPVPEGQSERDWQHLLAGAGPAKDFERHGPGGLGLVTWLGPRALALVPGTDWSALRLRSQAYAGGGLRLDLPCGHEAPLAEQFRDWKAASDSVAHLGLFAQPTFEGQETLRLLPGKRWRPGTLGMADPGGRAPPAPAVRGADADRLQYLTARARGGMPVQGFDGRGLVAVGADWRRLHAEGLNLTDADLSQALVDQAVWVDCDLDGARLNGTRFDGAHLDQVRLRRAQASGASFAGAEITNCFMQHACVAGSDFGGSLLRGCEANQLTAPGADFEGAFVEDSRFDGANFQATRFVRTEFVRCSFDGCDLRGADLASAQFEGCSFEGALRDD